MKQELMFCVIKRVPRRPIRG